MGCSSWGVLRAPREPVRRKGVVLHACTQGSQAMSGSVERYVHV